MHNPQKYMRSKVVAVDYNNIDIDRNIRAKFSFLFAKGDEIIITDKEDTLAYPAVIDNVEGNIVNIQPQWDHPVGREELHDYCPHDSHTDDEIGNDGLCEAERSARAKRYGETAASKKLTPESVAAIAFINKRRADREDT